MLHHVFAAIALLATSVVAQGTQGLPSCATSCITNYGGCNQVDVQCICSNQDLLTQLSCCVSQKCSPDDIQTVIRFADTLCGSYGVTTLPTAASCSGTATGSATSSGTGDASATGTHTGTASSPPASASASATSSATRATASASGVSQSTASSASSAASESGSLADRNYKAVGVGIGMAMLGFLAVL